MVTVMPVSAPTKDDEVKTRPKGDQSRAAILEAAASLFATKGFRGTSLASIAEAAGLSQPGLIHHFPSKADVLVAVLAERDRQDEARFRERHEAAPHDVFGLLAELVAYDQTRPDQARLHSVLLGEGLDDQHPAHDFFVARGARGRAEMVRGLQRAEADGDIASGADLPAIAAVVLAVMDGLQSQWLLDPSVDMDHCFGVFLSMLERSLSPRPAIEGPPTTATESEQGR